MFRSPFVAGMLVLAGSFAALPVAMRAQEANPLTYTSSASTRHPRHHRAARALFRGVHLTDAQRASFRTVHAKYSAPMRSARQNGDQQTLRTLRKQQIDEMRGMLTPEQQTRFDANRAALRARAQKHHAKQSGTQPSAQPDGQPSAQLNAPPGSPPSTQPNAQSNS